MAHKSNKQRKPTSKFHSTISCGNTTISSINESPQSNIPSDINLPGVQHGSVANADTGNVEKNSDSDSNSDEESLNEYRGSVFEYPEWVTLCDLNDAGGDDNCDNSTKASTKKPPKPGWRCNFCNQVFIGRNATKVICHLAGVKRMNIKKCRGIIPEKHL